MGRRRGDDRCSRPSRRFDAFGERLEFPAFGLRVGGAKVSEMHCNFLINDRNATAEDVERLGETVRARVRETSGVMLQWEIIRLGVPKAGRPTGEALVEAVAAR